MRRVRKAVATPYAVLICTGLLITLCASANAATVHRSKPRHFQGCPFPTPLRHGRRSTTTTPLATTIRPSLAAARRYKNETTRSSSEPRPLAWSTISCRFKSFICTRRGQSALKKCSELRASFFPPIHRCSPNVVNRPRFATVEKLSSDRECNSSRRWRVHAQRHVTRRWPESVIVSSADLAQR
jgi:hypothetical protein